MRFLPVQCYFSLLFAVPDDCLVDLITLGPGSLYLQCCFVCASFQHCYVSFHHHVCPVCVCAAVALGTAIIKKTSRWAYWLMWLRLHGLRRIVSSQGCLVEHVLCCLMVVGVTLDMLMLMLQPFQSGGYVDCPGARGELYSHFCLLLGPVFQLSSGPHQSLV